MNFRNSLKLLDLYYIQKYQNRPEETQSSSKYQNNVVLEKLIKNIENYEKRNQYISQIVEACKNIKDISSTIRRVVSVLTSDLIGDLVNSSQKLAYHK